MFELARKVSKTKAVVITSTFLLSLQMPAQKLQVGMFGLDIEMKLPNSVMNPATMPGADLNISSSEELDYVLAVLFPIVLAVTVLPFVTMRAAMMEMDCFVASRKLLDAIDVESYVYRKNKRSRRRRRSSTPEDQPPPTVTPGGVSLLDTVARNTDSREVKCRMYTAICCGVCGMGIMVMVFMLLGAVVFGAFYTIAS